MEFSLKEDYIFVNYHYIRDPSEKYKGINSCQLAEFEKQIKFLNGSFKIVSVSDVVTAAVNGTADKFCAVTFDDCLKDVYLNAVPILNKYNCKTTLFPITSVFKGQLPSVHKIHILLSNFSAEHLIDFFNDYLKREYAELGNKYKIPKDRRISETLRLDDDILTANLKEALIFIPRVLKNDFTDSCFKELKLDEETVIEVFFMNRDEIKELAGYGFEIGNHSHCHDNMTNLSSYELIQDVCTSREVLSDILGNKTKIESFSYPHGRCNAEILNVLISQNFKHALTIEERGISKKDNPFLLPRYDTNSIRDYLKSVN